MTTNLDLFITFLYDEVSANGSKEKIRNYIEYFYNLSNFTKKEATKNNVLD